MNHPVDHAVRRAACRLSGPVRIGDARDRCSRMPNRLAIELEILLDRLLVNGVQARADRRRRLRPPASDRLAVLQARSGEHDLRARVARRATTSSSTRLPRRLMSRSVHGSSMLRTAPDCPDRLNDQLLAGDQLRHQLAIAQIAFDDARRRCARTRRPARHALAQRRQDRDPRAVGDQASRQVRRR